MIRLHRKMTTRNASALAARIASRTAPNTPFPRSDGNPACARSVRCTGKRGPVLPARPMRHRRPAPRAAGRPAPLLLPTPPRGPGKR